MANPATTTGQGGHFETIGNGGKTGVSGYQPRPAAGTTSQAAGIANTPDKGTVIKTTTGAMCGAQGYPE